MDEDKTAFARSIGAKAARKLASQGAGLQPAWSGLSVFGVIGWSIVVPTLLGAFGGAWLDRHRSGGRSWTLALLAAGLALGCGNAWMWMSRQRSEIVDDATRRPRD